MALSDIKIRQAKPKDTPYKLADGQNLFLHIQPNGGKYWRYRYNWLGKEKTLALGIYPDVSLAQARERREQARKQRAGGVDPGEFKKEQKRQAMAEDGNTFEIIAREWLEMKASSWTAYYSKQVRQRLENDIFPKLGHRPITAITAPDLLKVVKQIEARDAIEIAHRAMQVCGQIFTYGIITDRVDRNPATDLRGALKAPVKNNYAYLSHNQLPEFLKKLEAYDAGHIQTKLAIKMLLLTFVRTNELCGAKWAEIDLANKEWRIPAERMKMRNPHIVPLSSQVLDILGILKKLNGHREYVFPSVQVPRKCMSNNTMLFAIYAMGYKKKTTGHGFRATASTILYESGLFERDAIERQLSHQERSRVVAAYNHSEHLPKRRIMMQWWADYLDTAAAKAMDAGSYRMAS